MAGTDISFSQADLAAMAAAYDPAKHEAPIVIGHPQHNLPAYGWIKGLSAEGDDLYAEAGEVNPEFADMVKAGAFKKVSAAFYAQNSGVYPLRHVGFLGAQPPAIKGLKQTEFADAGNMVSIETTLQTPEFSEPETHTVTPEEKAAIEAENAALKAQVAAAQAAFTKAKQEHTHASNLAFAEGLASQGKLKDGDKTVVIAVLDHLANADQPIEFSEGDGKPAKPLLEAYKATLQTNTAPVAFGEFVTGTLAATKDAANRHIVMPNGYQLSDDQQTRYDQAIAFAEAHKISVIEAAITLENTP